MINYVILDGPPITVTEIKWCVCNCKLLLTPSFGGSESKGDENGRQSIWKTLETLLEKKGYENPRFRILQIYFSRLAF